jgi:lipopolysaccharide biosynthesis protein
LSLSGFVDQGLVLPAPRLPAPQLDGPIGIHLHLYYPSVAQEFLEIVRAFPVRLRVLITTCDEASVPPIENLLIRPGADNLEAKIVVVPNRGRDVAPWLAETPRYLGDCAVICHLHSKKSAQYAWGDDWRRYLYRSLLSSPNVENILWAFAQDVRLGVVIPPLFDPLKNVFLKNHIDLRGMDADQELQASLLKRMGFPPALMRHRIFFSAGTMFWYRPKALEALTKLGLTYDDFPPEPIGVGGTLAHAIERLPSLVAKYSGYTSRVILQREESTASWYQLRGEEALAATDDLLNELRTIKNSTLWVVGQRVLKLFGPKGSSRRRFFSSLWKLGAPVLRKLMSRGSRQR